MIPQICLTDRAGMSDDLNLTIYHKEVELHLTYILIHIFKFKISYVSQPPMWLVNSTE
jgi:hypothetical protein